MMVTKNWNVRYQLWYWHEVEEKKWHFFSITLSDKFAKKVSESSRNFSFYKAASYWLEISQLCPNLTSLMNRDLHDEGRKTDTL